MQRAIPAVVMRGGSSRALLFHRRDLPEDLEAQDDIFRSALGCPDPVGRQVDGLGGTSSSTNKVGVISLSADDGADVDFAFAQLAMERELVDRAGTCGNITAAVGPFAIDEGLVPAVEPTTRVRIRATNTGKLVVAHVPTHGGRFDPEGDYVMAGVPGTGSPIDLDFVDPAGSLTGALLPTGNPADALPVLDDFVRASLVDAGTAIAFVTFQALGLAADATPVAVDADAALLARLEALRAQAAVAMGLAATAAEASARLAAAPKLVLVGPACEGGEPRDVQMLAISMGRAHRALALTAGVCAGAASLIDGTVVREALGARAAAGADGLQARIGHPSGVMEVRVAGAESPSPTSRT